MKSSKPWPERCACYAPSIDCPSLPSIDKDHGTKKFHLASCGIRSATRLRPDPFAMRKLRFKRAPLGLTEEERYRLADETVKEKKRCGGWQSLGELLEKDSGAPAYRNDAAP